MEFEHKIQFSCKNEISDNHSLNMLIKIPEYININQITKFFSKYAKHNNICVFFIGDRIIKEKFTNISKFSYSEVCKKNKILDVDYTNIQYKFFSDNLSHFYQYKDNCSVIMSPDIICSFYSQNGWCNNKKCNHVYKNENYCISDIKYKTLDFNIIFYKIIYHWKSYYDEILRVKNYLACKLDNNVSNIILDYLNPYPTPIMFDNITKSYYVQ